MLPPSPHRSPPSCSQQPRIVTSNLRHDPPVPECLRPLETRLLRSASTRLHSRIGAGRCRLQQCTRSAGRAGRGSAQPVSCFSDTKSGSGATVRVVFSFLPVDPQSKPNFSEVKPNPRFKKTNKTKPKCGSGATIRVVVSSLSAS